MRKVIEYCIKNGLYFIVEGKDRENFVKMIKKEASNENQELLLEDLLDEGYSFECQPSMLKDLLGLL